MNVTELVSFFRKDMSDEEEPQLWSDAEVYYYADQAQKMFCRKTGGLGDASTPSVTQLIIPADSSYVVTHPAILTIHNAFVLTATATPAGAPVRVVNYRDMVRHGHRFNAVPNRLRNLVIGMEPHKIFFDPIVNETALVQLVVDRLPIVPIVEPTTDPTDPAFIPQEFEVDEQHHADLALWMKHLAYSKQDAETYDRGRATDFEARFEAYCIKSKMEKERAMHKTRIVQYGGL